ncbi:hypothetical protein SAMN05444166_2329 [Singulisphaera sp. GP187]|nr:hypothetical protein SAMN05444166_2329 [Singulisphaera sp. GP187]
MAELLEDALRVGRPEMFNILTIPPADHTSSSVQI